MKDHLPTPRELGAGPGRRPYGVLRLVEVRLGDEPVHPDGSVHHLQAWTDVETDDTGRARRIQGATIDVTEQAVAGGFTYIHSSEAKFQGAASPEQLEAMKKTHSGH